MEGGFVTVYDHTPNSGVSLEGQIVDNNGQPVGSGFVIAQTSPNEADPQVAALAMSWAVKESVSAASNALTRLRTSACRKD